KMQRLHAGRVTPCEQIPVTRNGIPVRRRSPRFLTAWVGIPSERRENPRVASNQRRSRRICYLKHKAPVEKQLYRLNIEPRVIDQLTKLAARTGEPKTRLATRLFTDAVMGFKPNGRGKAAPKS